MEFLFAPMEGITFAVYRRLHHRFFPGAAEYYTPFIAPDTTGSFKPKYLRELTNDSCSGYKVIPQLLANRPEPFMITAGKLMDLGFEEFNLNAGCPSGTVFAKHKGSGMLADLSSFRAFLDAVFSDAEKRGYRISVKTRMGVHSTSEFPAILKLYNAYPLSRLIIHARDRDGQYSGEPDPAAFAEAFRQSSCPVTYNGDLFSAASLEAVLSLVPEAGSFMVGRGAAANPALIRELSGGDSLRCEELEAFHEALLTAYLEGGLSPAFAVERMKQLFYYMHWMFDDCRKEYKALLKSKTLPDYRAAAGNLFHSGKFNARASFQK